MNFLKPFKRLFSSSPLLSEVFKQRYIPQKLPAASDSTIKSYRITFRLFDEFLGRPAKLSDLSDETVSGFVAHRLETVAVGTVKRDTDNIKAVWRWCCRKGLVELWPDLKQLYPPRRTPIALTEEQIASVWKAIQDETEGVVISCSPKLAVPGNVWWSAIFLVCWDTGERFTPVFELKEGNIDLETLWIRFPAEDRKGQREDITRQIAPDTAKAIGRLLEHYPRRHYSTRVFRWAMNRGIVWKQLGQIMVRAGLPNTKEFKFHSFRRSCASHLKAAGGDPTEQLGHSSSVITKRSYLDPRIAKPTPSVELLFRPGGNGQASKPK